MTQMQDPNEIWRASLTEVDARAEKEPPRILRAEVWPYPELNRLWVRLEISPFAAFPNLELILLDPDSQEMFSLNESGRAIWRALPGRSVDEVAALLATEYEVEEAAARLDVRGLVTRLAGAGLLRRADGRNDG